MAKWANPRVIIRRNAMASEFMQNDGTWGIWDTAKRFKSDSEADRFAALYGVDDHGIFPVSTPRLIS